MWSLPEESAASNPTRFIYRVRKGLTPGVGDGQEAQHAAVHGFKESDTTE